tara:strand:- start:1578 stop:1862 length:285 start_codon:yes stop_codon:yes gene_type:complete
MINKHSEVEIMNHQINVIDGITDLLKVYDVPQNMIGAVMKDIGIMNRNEVDALPCCGRLAKEVQASWKVEEESDFMEDLKIGVRPEFPSVSSQE